VLAGELHAQPVPQLSRDRARTGAQLCAHGRLLVVQGRDERERSGSRIGTGSGT
jgi:hypothetical protein